MLWKIITITLLILLLIFGFLALKNKSILLGSTKEITTSAEDFSNNYMNAFKDLTGNVAVIPTNFAENVPTVSTSELGELSPMYGKIKISEEPWGPETTQVEEEYVILQANEENIEPIDITGWSLQSMVSGVRVYIPDGVEDLIVNDINPTYEVEMAPGSTAVVSTAPSPLGVSFKTNMCTGYLGQFQNYEPTLTNRCPLPRTVLPPTITNIQTYGGKCMDLVSQLRPCEYLTDRILRESDVVVSNACIEYLRTALTYTSCRARNKDTKEYLQDAQWRIFLSEQNALWKEQYEVIRLLDKADRTVDVYSY